MNKLLYCFFLSFSVMATSACTDDKEERELPPAPDFSLMILKENLHSNGGDVLRTDTYVYDNNKLTTHTTLQEFYGQSLTHETTLSYSGNEVTLADENGNTAIYILGSAGYATECTYKLSDQFISVFCILLFVFFRSVADNQVFGLTAQQSGINSVVVERQGVSFTNLQARELIQVLRISRLIIGLQAIGNDMA